MVYAVPCANINSLFWLGAIHWIWVFATFVFPLHMLMPAIRPPELINYKTKLQIPPSRYKAQETCRNPLWNAVMWSFSYPNLLSNCNVTFIYWAFKRQKLVKDMIYYLCTTSVRQQSPSLKHFMNSRSGGSIFEAPAALQIYTEQKNNKPWWMLGWVGRSKRQGNHLRGREPWGIEEKEASEYVSSAKPISKWLPAPCTWKLKRENREI